MKRYIYNLMLWSIVSLWVFSSCEDYAFDDIPDPVVPEDMTPGLKLSKDTIMIDAMGNAQGFELRAIGGKWSVEPDQPTDWLLDCDPKGGDEGNAVVGVTLRVNESVQERFMRLIIRQEGTGAVDTVLVGQYTYESKYTRKTDSLALIEIYEALHGEDVWRVKWNYRKPITEWTGVVLGDVNGVQRVVKLNLTDYSLWGELPTEIGSLRELTSIRISPGKINGRVPNSLINLRKLESLNINFTDGAEWFLPDDMSTMLSLKEFKPAALKISMPSFASFYTLPALETLELSSIYIVGDLPAGISKMKNLKSLNLAGTNLYRLPVDIGDLAETLTTLNLGRCASLVSLDNVFKLVNLTSLSLSGCKMLEELPEGFGNLSKITTLDVSGCERLKKLSSDIGNLKIGSLVILGCKSLIELPESFGNLTLSGVLNLRDCESLVGLPESIGLLTKITELNLSNCKSLVSLPESLKNMVALKKITMTSTALTTLPAVLSGMTELEELDITGTEGGTGISGVAAEVFGGMAGLKKLSAGNNSFSGNLAWVKNLPNLQLLKMEKNQLSGTVDFNDFGLAFTDIYLNFNKLEGNLDGITRLTKLRNFYLHDNLLSGNLPENIGDCTAMYYMHLQNNNITGTIPAGLAKMNSLGYAGLNVKMNKMSGIIPATVLSSAIWKKLYPLTDIYPQQEGFGFTNIP